MSRRGTRLEVNLNALKHNYNYLRKQIPGTTKFMGVVKANAYGHGIMQVSETLIDAGVDYLSVAYAAEAIQIRKKFTEIPILVLHPQIHEIPDLVEYQLEPVIYGWEVLEEFIAFAKAIKNNLPIPPIHVEFNTGLNRLGFEVGEAKKVGEAIKSADKVSAVAVSSHLAASDDRAEDAFTEKQIRLFIQAAEELEKTLGHDLLRHQSNTSGVLNFPDAHFSFVRAGIGLYGYGNDLEMDKNLKPVGRLLTNISQIRYLKKGDTVSYNRKFTAEKDMRCAVLSIGHGDGINRIYGHGRSYVLINGQKAFTLGIICMDMFMVDVTDIDCEVGDEVEIIGERQSAAQLAESAGTISYELLTGLQKRIPRVYLPTS